MLACAASLASIRCLAARHHPPQIILKSSRVVLVSDSCSTDLQRSTGSSCKGDMQVLVTQFVLLHVFQEARQQVPLKRKGWAEHGFPDGPCFGVHSVD
jgi:hypothetical protein